VLCVWVWVTVWAVCGLCGDCVWGCVGLCVCVPVQVTVQALVCAAVQAPVYVTVQAVYVTVQVTVQAVYVTVHTTPGLTTSRSPVQDTSANAHVLPDIFAGWRAVAPVLAQDISRHRVKVALNAIRRALCTTGPTIACCDAAVAFRDMAALALLPRDSLVEVPPKCVATYTALVALATPMPASPSLTYGEARLSNQRLKDAAFAARIMYCIGL
jgi:hypothetical protein